MKRTCFYLLLPALLAISCSSKPHTNDEIQQAMNNYDSLLLKQDAAEIANAFTPNGKLGTVATGRAEIQKFISQFKQYKVIEQTSITNDIQIKGDSALQRGAYIQRDIDEKKDTLKVSGSFICKWKWLDGEGWKIDNMVTSPFQ